MNRKQESLLNFSVVVTFVMLLFGFGVLAWLGGGVDFRSYFGAAMLVREGGNPYDYQQLAPVLEQISGFQGNNAYYNPPWFALLFIPLTFLPYQVARAAWLLINLALFWGALCLIVQALPRRLPVWQTYLIYTGLLFMLGAYCLRSEQVGITLLFGLALFVWGIQFERDGWAAFGLLLLTTKPQVTFLMLFCLGLWILFYRRGVLRWGLGLLGGATIVSSAAIPRWWMFDRTGFASGLNVELAGADLTVVATRVNTTLADFLTHQFNVSQFIQPWLIGLVTVMVLWLIGYSWLVYRDLHLLISSSLMATLLITPYTLQYDYPPLAFVVLLITAVLPQLNREKIAAIALLLAGGLLVPLFQSWSYQGFWLLLAVCAAYLLAFIFFQAKHQEEPQNVRLSSGD